VPPLGTAAGADGGLDSGPEPLRRRRAALAGQVLWDLGAAAPDGLVHGHDLERLFRMAGVAVDAGHFEGLFEYGGEGDPLDPADDLDQRCFLDIVDGDLGPSIADEDLARFLCISGGAQEAAVAPVLRDSDGFPPLGARGPGEQTWGANRGPPGRSGPVPPDEGTSDSRPSGGDVRQPTGSRTERPRPQGRKEHVPAHCWGRYSSSEVAVRRGLVQQVSSALAASSPGGLLRPPELRRLGLLAGYDLPAHAVSCAGNGLDPADEEDFLCLLDFLDSAAGLHFCNEDLDVALQRLSSGAPPVVVNQSSALGAPATPPRPSAAATASGSAPAVALGRAPRSAATTARGAVAATADEGPSGRRWDYSRFDAIRDSSDEEADG